MHRRCYVQHDEHYPRYGGRGIIVCTPWHTFENFLKDMGPRPSKTTLDRIDNSGHYCKENCRWATHKVQQNNRRPAKSNKGFPYGVSFKGDRKRKKPWQAQAKGTLLGCFLTMEDAESAVKKYLEKLV